MVLVSLEIRGPTEVFSIAHFMTHFSLILGTDRDGAGVITSPLGDLGEILGTGVVIPL